MKAGMTLPALISEVMRQNGAKRDFVTSTKDNIRMVGAEGFPQNVAVVLLKDQGAELERFSISDNAHKQIADKLEIPTRYYGRLLEDHPDMIIDQVNKLFEREPASRLIRVLDGKVRAFLSDRYLRLDNQQVLEQTLPAIVNGTIQTELLSSNVGESYMDVKVLFTDPSLKQEITKATRTGASRVVSPGFRMRNSETGHGSLSIKGFFFDGYCKNGCIYGLVEGFDFSRSHLGGKLLEGVNFEILSDKSKRLEDETIISQVTDVMKAMASVEFATQMGSALRAAANSEQAKQPIATIDFAIKELGLQEAEKTSILTTFLQDGDFSKWGLASAVTSAANSEAVTYERASELEDIGSKILSMELGAWRRLANADLKAPA